MWEPFDYLGRDWGHWKRSYQPQSRRRAKRSYVGSKDFLPPTGLGRMRSTRSYVIVLRKGKLPDFSQYFEKASAMAPGQPVWTWSADLGEFGDRDPRSSALYATQIAQSYILVSNSLEELKTVSNLLTTTRVDFKQFMNGRMLTRMNSGAIESTGMVCLALPTRCFLGVTIRSGPKWRRLFFMLTLKSRLACFESLVQVQTTQRQET